MSIIKYVQNFFLPFSIFFISASLFATAIGSVLLSTITNF